MILEKKIPLWAQRGLKMLAHRGRLQGLVLCAIDKDCNLTHYAIGEGVNIIVDKIKNEIVNPEPVDSSVLANPPPPVDDAGKVAE